MVTTSSKALFTRNAGICICVKNQEWVLWQQVIMFTFSVCIFKKGTAKIKEKYVDRPLLQSS